MPRADCGVWIVVGIYGKLSPERRTQMKITIYHPSELTPGSPSCLVRGFSPSDTAEDGWTVHAVLQAKLPDDFATDLIGIMQQYEIEYTDNAFKDPVCDSAYAVEGYIEWLLKTDKYWNVRYTLTVRRFRTDCWTESCRRIVHEITTS